MAPVCVADKHLNAWAYLPTALQLQIIQEAGIMRACAHKHCTTLLEAHQGVDSGICYVVMEHVEHSLSRELLLNPRGLLLPKAKIVAFQLCTALEHVHSKKVSHCPCYGPPPAPCTLK